MLQRYFIPICYNGLRYCGWQIQPNGTSVQGVLTHCIGLLLGQPTAITGAGRTDAGVHALRTYAHFDVPQPLASPDAFAARLNRFLPSDIAVGCPIAVPPNAHARFDATARRYEYRITTVKNPFAEGLAWYVHYALNVAAMNAAAHILFDYTDFTSFSKLHTDAKTNDCIIYKAEWTQQNAELIFTIEANRFLRNMVRAIVGTMIDVGKGTCTADDVRSIIKACNRCAAGQSVPPYGLYLKDVRYPYIHPEPL